MSRPNLRIAGISIAVAIAVVMPAAAEPIAVKVNHAKVMRISRPADIVIIGNPAIADAIIQDQQTLIITGRSFGTTNLIVLDATGEAIADEQITVGASQDNVVTVFRRASRQSYSCSPECSPMLAVGDNESAFDAVSAQIQTQGSLTDNAAAR